MFILNQNSGNTVSLTLSENTTLTSPKFLFNVTNDDTKKSKTFIGIDTTGLTRYNLFTITLTGNSANEILTAGTVNLVENGWWKYDVYEQTSTTNLKLSGTTKLIEQGKLFVSGTTGEPNYLFNDTEDTNTTYQT